MARRLDALIVGGGPAGAVCAYCLARAGHSVAVVERGDYQAERVGETLPGQAFALLDELELGDAARGQGHETSWLIRSAWRDAELRDTHHRDNPFGGFWHLDRRRFDRFLLDSAAAAGAEVHVAKRPEELDLEAAFVIDATGRASSVARARGAVRKLDDDLVGVVGFPRVPAARPAGEHYTMTEALEDGWWYTARLPSSRFVAIFMTDAELLPKGRSAAAAFYDERLRASTHTRQRLEGLVFDSEVRVVSAGSAQLDRVAAPGWIAVGDAACSFDPLSGVGVWHALDSARRAAYAVSASLAEDDAALADYQHEQEVTYRGFRDELREIYARNQRWPLARFWRRRM